MALNIKSDRAHELARALSEATGDTLTDVVTDALQHRLADVPRKEGSAVLLAEVREVQAFVRSLPERGTDSDEAIIGYDDFGLPG